MKKKNIIIIIVCVAAIALAAAVIVNLIPDSGKTTDVADYGTTSLTDDQEEIQELFRETYDVDNQQMIADNLEEKKAADEYTADNMLIEYNPFGTNTTSLYVYFESEDAVSVEYTVHVDDDSIDDFTATAYQDSEYQMEHEFQVLGLIPDMENTITFTLTSEDGTVTTRETTYEMGSLYGDEEICLEVEVTDAEGAQEVSDGLYVVMGNDSTALDFMYYYDANGVLRGEIPIIGYRSHRLLFDEDEGVMYYSISTSKLAEVNRLGQVTDVYDLGDYNLHHDYVFDDDGNILILGSDTTSETVEDLVLCIDRETGEVEELADLGDFFSDIKDRAVKDEDDEDGLDWLHVNTIQWVGEDDAVILSSRETSTIIKLSNIYDAPTVDYIIGDEEYWKDTDEENLLLSKVGDFTIQGGQHTVTYVEDDSLEEGQYYLYMFNNNIGISNSNPDFDWSAIGLTNSAAKAGDNSYYYEYLVDEDEGTFELVDSFAVPYSGYVSSVQNLDGETVVDSGLPGSFAVYDEDHNELIRYTMEVERFIYRVYKYDFNGYYFR